MAGFPKFQFPSLVSTLAPGTPVIITMSHETSGLIPASINPGHILQSNYNKNKCQKVSRIFNNLKSIFKRHNGTKLIFQIIHHGKMLTKMSKRIENIV